MEARHDPTAAAQEDRRRLAPGLILAVAVYLGLRALMLVTNFDESAMHMYELYPMGTIPEMLIEGIDVPLHYSYDNAAGQLVVGVLTTPFYAVFGPTYLALKLVPLLLGLGALILVWMFLDGLGNRRAADLGALLFALGPPTAAKYSLMASGNHYENLFFTMLAVWSFFRLHRSFTGLRLFAAGFCSGLAIFVFLGAITPVGLLALTHSGLRGLRRSVRDLGIGGAGFALGIAPLVVVNSITAGRGASFLQAKFAGDGNVDLARVGERFASFFTEHLPVATCFEDFLGVDGVWVDRLFLACFAAAWIGCLPFALRAMLRLARGAFGDGTTADNAELVLLVAYLPLTGLAFGLSDLIIGNHAPPLTVAGYRYFLPHLMFAATLIGWAAARAWASALRPAGIALTSGALITAFFSLALVDFGFSRAGVGFHYQGYNFLSASKALIGKKNGLSQVEVIDFSKEYPAVFRRQIYTGIGFHHALKNTQRSPQPQSPDIEAVLEGYPAAHFHDLARGVGHYLRELTHYVPAQVPAVREQFEAWSRESAPFLDSVVAGFCQSWDFLLESRSAELLQANEDWRLSVSPPLRESFARGQGLLCGRLAQRAIPQEQGRVRAAYEALDPELRRAFAQGFGRGLADGAEHPELPSDLSVYGLDDEAQQTANAAFQRERQVLFATEHSPDY